MSTWILKTKEKELVVVGVGGSLRGRGAEELTVIPRSRSAGESGVRAAGRVANFPVMKSVFFSRFFILLPWVLIVIIMIDVDTKRTSRAPAVARAAGRTQQQHRTARPGGGGGGGAPAATGVNRSSFIYAITPTYTRPVQKAELTRLTNAFRQVPSFHWIVVEDSTTRTDMVARFLARSGVPYTHLNVFTPRRFKRTGMPRATEQRNAALAWLRQHRSRRDAGVVFFADDDNTYSLELFEEVGNILISCSVRHSAVHSRHGL